ncbi:hypothetical protein AcV7_004008 [Taiwanofungus camphoratus]|nr:hypothetical protein AcV7_004008 [Antrodia cinnamomea]
MPSARGAARAALICCCSRVFADACPPLIRPQSASSHRGASQCVAGCDGGTGHAARCTGPDRVATFTRLLRPPPHFTLCCWDLGTLGPLAPAVWTGLAATRISHPAPGHASACTGHAMFSGAHDVGRRATSGCRRPGSGCSLGAPPVLRLMGPAIHTGATAAPSRAATASPPPRAAAHLTQQARPRKLRLRKPPPFPSPPLPPWVSGTRRSAPSPRPRSPVPDVSGRRWRLSLSLPLPSSGSSRPASPTRADAANSPWSPAAGPPDASRLAPPALRHARLRAQVRPMRGCEDSGTGMAS